jgi:hypothetical protein
MRNFAAETGGGSNYQEREDAKTYKRVIPFLQNA